MMSILILTISNAFLLVQGDHTNRDKDQDDPLAISLRMAISTFVCYLFLMWAKVHKLLTRYNEDLQTIGQLKEAFSNYCQDRFVNWLAEVKQQCKTCPIANWIHDHVYCNLGKNGGGMTDNRYM